MSITEKQFQLIVKHLDQSSSESESAEFNLLLESSEEFRKEVKIMENIVDSSSALNRAEDFKYIKSKFDEFEREKKNQSKSRFISTYLAVAASVALVLISSIFYFNNDNFDARTAFLENYEPFPVRPSVRNDQNQLLPGLQFYKEGKYQEAIPLLEQESKNNVINCIYLSNAYIETGNYHKAKEVLKSYIPEIEDKVIRRYANWYLGLTYLALNEPENAEDQFELLAENKGPFQQQSLKLVEKLKKR